MLRWKKDHIHHNHYLQKEKEAKTICIEEKVTILINFNPGLVVTGFQTILPCFQQVNLTLASDPIQNQHLVSGKLKKKSRDLDDM